jgi:hypothetical protein
MLILLVRPTLHLIKRPHYNISVGGSDVQVGKLYADILFIYLVIFEKKYLPGRSLAIYPLIIYF